MNLKRTTLIFVVCAAVAAWFSAAMTPGGRQPVIAPAPASPVDSKGAALAAEIARLHDRLRPDAPPRDRLRNLFAFRAASRAVPSAARTAEPALTGAQAPVAPTVVPLTIAGMAEDAGPDGPVRTAVLSGDGQVFLLKEGETLTLRGTTYRVVTISEKSVELIDVSAGASRTLTLK